MHYPEEVVISGKEYVEYLLHKLCIKHSDDGEPLINVIKRRLSNLSYGNVSLEKLQTELPIVVKLLSFLEEVEEPLVSDPVIPIAPDADIFGKPLEPVSSSGQRKVAVAEAV